MKNGIIFANASAKAKELELLNDERIHRMMESTSLEDAIRVLNEVGYGNGTSCTQENFDSILSEKEKDATDFVRSVAVKGIGIECFFLRNDFHNLKVLVKSKYTTIDDIAKMLLPHGVYKFNEIQENFEKGNLDLLDKYMANAVNEITYKFNTGKGSARIIDTTLDKWLFKEITDILAKNGADKHIRDYFKVYIDTTNISSFLRVIKIGANMNFFEECFLDGGSIELDKFTSCGSDLTAFSKVIEMTDYSKMYSAITDISDLSAFETAKDEYVLKEMAKFKNDMLSIAPAVGYYLARLNEIKTLRVIFVCVKNKVSLEETKKRVRALYA